MASRSTGMPGPGGYWLRPPLIASIAASSTSRGPSVSGKPWPRLTLLVATASCDISAKIVVPKPWSLAVRWGTRADIGRQRMPLARIGRSDHRPRSVQRGDPRARVGPHGSLSRFGPTSLAGREQRAEEVVPHRVRGHSAWARNEGRTPAESSLISWSDSLSAFVLPPCDDGAPHGRGRQFGLWSESSRRTSVAEVSSR